jgi:hypothetical protein
LNECPHCGSPLGPGRRVALAIAGVAGGGVVSMTLMACYGAPCTNDIPCDEPDPVTDAGDPTDAGISQ